MDQAKLAKMQASVRIVERVHHGERSRRCTRALEPTTRSSRPLLRSSTSSPSRPSRRSTCSRRTETSSTSRPPRFTPPSPPTPSPSTETARTRSLPSSFPVSSTSLAPTPWPLSASSPRATRACRRRRVTRTRRRSLMTRRFPSWSRVRTSRTRSKSLSPHSLHHQTKNKPMHKTGVSAVGCWVRTAISFFAFGHLKEEK